MDTQNNTAVMTIEYHLTKQAEAYTSIRAGVSLPVFVEPDDDLHATFEHNLAVIKETVQAEIDAEFEAIGKPAPYSDEPRGYIVLLSDGKLGAILPDYIHSQSLPGLWAKPYPQMSGHRLTYIHAEIPARFRDCIFFDCSDGDLEKLPPLSLVRVWINKNAGLTVFSVGDGAEAQMPWEIKRAIGGYWEEYTKTGLSEQMGRWLTEKMEGTPFDCSRGDFEKVTEYAATQGLIETPEMEVDDYEDDEDEWENDDDYEDDE